jgi:hypothetical protein
LIDIGELGDISLAVVIAIVPKLFRSRVQSYIDRIPANPPQTIALARNLRINSDYVFLLIYINFLKKLT